MRVRHLLLKIIGPSNHIASSYTVLCFGCICMCKYTYLRNIYNEHYEDETNGCTKARNSFVDTKLKGTAVKGDVRLCTVMLFAGNPPRIFCVMLFIL